MLASIVPSEMGQTADHPTRPEWEHGHVFGLERRSYDRALLLCIGDQHKDYSFHSENIPPEILRSPELHGVIIPPARRRRRRRERKQKRGKRAGLRARLQASPYRPAVPSLFLANSRSLVNKMDEIRLRITSNNMNSCVVIITETWLNRSVPDAAIELAGHSVYRADRTEASGKSRGGGLCIYIHNNWCTAADTIEQHCSPDLEFLTLRCRPFFLPREFSAVLLTAVYIPPQANAKLALSRLHDAINNQLSAHPDGVVIVAGDFNHADLKSVMPKFYNNVRFPTRESNILDQKPWVNKSVRALIKSRDEAFRSGDRLAYSAARRNLKKGIKEAKHSYKQRIEEHFENNNPRSMWNGIKALTDYKTNTPQASDDTSLPDVLNQFFARFDNQNRGTHHTAPPVGDQTLVLKHHQVKSTLQRVNVNKAAGPDGVCGRTLKACASQLAEVFTNIFNLSLKQAAVPTFFKTSTIIPVPKKSVVKCLNDYRPVALTPIVMKCFERLVLSHIKAVIPPDLDQHQFAYRTNRSTEDAVSMALHTALTHLEQPNTYVRMLFVDFSSAFNTIIPHKLVSKLGSLGLDSSICSWVLGFLTDRPQCVRIGNHTSSTLILNTGTPQGCVLSPLLFTLFTNDCTPTHSSNTIIKFADDTTIVGLISDGDERAYRNEVECLDGWCKVNDLVLNTSKTKEIVVDFRRTKKSDHLPLHISGAEVERVEKVKFLGVHITNHLTWSSNTSYLCMRAQQRLYFLRKLKQAQLPQKLLVNFYRSTIESILSHCMIVCVFQLHSLREEGPASCGQGEVVSPRLYDVVELTAVRWRSAEGGGSMFLHSRSPGSTGNPLQAGEERESRAAPLGESSVRRWEKVSDAQISRQEREAEFPESPAAPGRKSFSRSAPAETGRASRLERREQPIGARGR
ncbi:hypothetical protein NFI96_007457 [Prochilodus magdalenae]|nr:hypothetical protein NFI96_007457 [Prochilodus magdalenae]